MAAALRGVPVPHWVAVHGVDDVAPGLYRWPDPSTPLRAGDLRDRLERVCLDRTLAAEAAYVVIAATPASASTTGATATPSSRPGCSRRGWSRAGCIWRRTPWVPARPGSPRPAGNLGASTRSAHVSPAHPRTGV